MRRRTVALAIAGALTVGLCALIFVTPDSAIGWPFVAALAWAGGFALGYWSRA